MKIQHPVLITVAALAVALAPVATTSTAPAPTPSGAPTAAELGLLASVAGWVATDQVASVERVRLERAGFEVFRTWHPRESRRARVATLPWGEAIFSVAQQQGLDSLLLASIVEVESRFRSDSVSPRGAIGLMQLMPETAGELALTDHTDPRANLEAGARYLRRLLDRFDGDLVLALAAYNAGPGAVERAGGIPPYSETRRYVEKVLACYVAHHREVWQDTEEHELLTFG